MVKKFLNVVPHLTSPRKEIYAGRGDFFACKAIKNRTKKVTRGFFLDLCLEEISVEASHLTTLRKEYTVKERFFVEVA